MNNPPKRIDISVINLDERHYIPPKRRNSTEIDRLHQLPHGTLIAEHVGVGVDIARRIGDHDFENPDDKAFLFGALAISTFNSDWYERARGSQDRMRKDGDLPIIAVDTPDGEQWRETELGLTTKMRSGLSHAADLADQVRIAHSLERPTERLRTKLGRQLTASASQLVSIDLTRLSYLNAFDLQSASRHEALKSQQRARYAADEIGVHPSVAQLATPRSPLSRWIQDNAPPSNEAHDLLDRLQTDFGLST